MELFAAVPVDLPSEELSEQAARESNKADVAATARTTRRVGCLRMGGSLNRSPSTAGDGNGTSTGHY
ncbi:hypothetical protein Ari01nite_17550 [Paractinoplanes rishiriensis]|uniref:Uncharacterized protein n=1 Tax=Paractinoplanes rishiriensis TaxID=1050105 RepID=A0A919JT18_9ACTN|nr:hypothetical protein Ari01nite_17550 [Actinoplanes rishiriensis]